MMKLVLLVQRNCENLDSKIVYFCRSHHVAWLCFCTISRQMHSSKQQLCHTYSVEKFVRLHTNAEHPIALDVANFILDFDESISQLPCWLEQVLMGEDTNDFSGLFACRPKPGSRIYLGDPSALLTLYIKKGMFLEACRVVIAILLGPGGSDSRRDKASSRLPVPPFFAVFVQTLGLFAQNVGFCPYFLHIAHLGIPEICAIARKYEFAQKSIFRCKETEMEGIRGEREKDSLANPHGI
jgi:hypothetical protein